MHDDDRVPAGLLEAMRADVAFPVRQAEVDRVRERLEVISLDDADVLEAIADRLLVVSAGAG